MSWRDRLEPLRQPALASATLALAAGTWIWALMSTPEQMIEYRQLPARYAFSLAVGVLPAALLAGIAWRLERGPLLARIACAACLLHLAALKAAGFGLAPWLALAGAVAGALALRSPPRIGALLLLLSIIGSLTALHFALVIERLLAIARGLFAGGG